MPNSDSLDSEALFELEAPAADAGGFAGLADRPLIELMAPDWAEALAPVEGQLRDVLRFLGGEVAGGRAVLPPPSNVLRAFRQPLADVKVLIEQSATEVAGGSKLVAEAASKLEAILVGIRENSTIMEGIARDSKEQASSIDEVNVAVRQMDEMTQHNAALVEETNAAIEQTEGQATQLDRIVDVFAVRDGSVRHRNMPERAAAPVSQRATRPAYASQGNAAIAQDWNEF